MAVKRGNTPQQSYGLGQPLLNMAPIPIVSQRAPTANDTAEIGQIWLDQPNQASYILTDITAGVANWSTAPTSGATTLASLLVTPGDLEVDTGDTILAGALTVAGLSTLGNATITGTVDFQGDVDFTSAALIDLTSTLDAAPSIYLHADGGVNEQILLRSDQGTAVDSVSLVSDVGGLTIQATGNATADAINISANSGGVDIDSALLMSLTSSRNNAQAILVEATAGGIDILASGAAAGEDIDIVATGSSVNISSTENAAGAITLTSNGGASETIVVTNTQGTNAASINLTSTVGGITLTSNLATADGINLNAIGGGVDVDGALQVNIASAQAAAANSVRIVASAADGGMDIDAGTGGITIDSTGAISIDAAAASNFTATGAGVDLTLASVLGSVLVSSTEDAALAIRLHADGGVTETIQLHADQGTSVGSINLLSDVGGITFTSGLASADAINLEASSGGIDMDSALQTNITSSQAAATALRLNASNAGGGIDIDCGTAGITIDSTGAFSIDGAAASNVTTTGAGIDLTLSSVLGSVLVSSTEDAADAIYLHANGGTTETVRIHADQGTGVGSVKLLSDVGGITLTATGLASADAINLEASAGGIDMDSALQTNIASSQAAADALRFNASNAAGGIDIDCGTAGIAIDTTGAVSIDSAAASNMTVTGAGLDLTLSSAGGSVLVSSTENTANSIYLHADGGTSETILIRADQGSGLGSIALTSDVGGVKVTTGALAATTGLNLVQGAQNASICVGTGAPAHNAPQGSLYLRTDGSSTSTRLYVNTDGAGTWTNFTSAA